MMCVRRFCFCLERARLDSPKLVSLLLALSVAELKEWWNSGMLDKKLLGFDEIKQEALQMHSDRVSRGP